MRKLKWIGLAVLLLFSAGNAKAASEKDRNALDDDAIAASIRIPVFAQLSGPTYFYVATTVDANGFESVNSNEVSATFNQGQHNAVLTWTAATVPIGGAPIAGYNIKRSKTTGGPYVKINAALITSGVTYTDAFVGPNAPTLAPPTTN